MAQGQLLTEEMFITPLELTDITLSESLEVGEVAIAM